MLDSIGCRATAKKRTIYANIRPEIDPIITKGSIPFIVLFNFIYLVIWLLFATHSTYWMPYGNILLNG